MAKRNPSRTVVVLPSREPRYADLESGDLLLSRHEVARLLDVTEKALNVMGARGYGPDFIRTGAKHGPTKYPLSWVQAWLDSREVVLSVP
jgi:hypothetical protein